MKHDLRCTCSSRGGVRRARLSGFWLLCCLLTAWPASAKEKTLWSRFSFENEIEVSQKWIDNPDLDRRDNDGLSELDVEWAMECAFKPSRHFKGVVELELDRDFFLYQGPENTARRDRTRLRLKQFYGDWKPGSGLIVRLGRQDVEDRREWLADKALDGLRLWRDFGDFSLDLALLRQLVWRDDIFRDENYDKGRNFVLAQSEYRPLDGHALGGYALLRDEHAGESQQQVLFGLRAHGTVAETLDYWADLGVLRGRRDGQRLEGHGFDLGATWRFEGALQPSLTVGYALGSGDRKGGSVNRTFRQSGLQDNTCRFNGVEDFQMYGEVLDPELSNIGITTLAVGIRPSARSSVDLVHHLYRQDVGVSGRLPGARIRARATGKSRDLGQGVDLIFGYREIDNLKLDLKLGVFLPDDGFGHDADSVHAVAITFTYSF